MYNAIITVDGKNHDCLWPFTVFVKTLKTPNVSYKLIKKWKKCKTNIYLV